MVGTSTKCSCVINVVLPMQRKRKRLFNHGVDKKRMEDLFYRKRKILSQEKEAHMKGEGTALGCWWWTKGCWWRMCFWCCNSAGCNCGRTNSTTTLEQTRQQHHTTRGNFTLRGVCRSSTRLALAVSRTRTISNTESIIADDSFLSRDRARE